MDSFMFLAKFLPLPPYYLEVILVNGDGEWQRGPSGALVSFTKGPGGFPKLIIQPRSPHLPIDGTTLVDHIGGDQQ